MSLSFLSKNEEMLVKLLSSSISEGTTIPDTNENVEWDKVFEMACRHQVMTLIYPLIKSAACDLSIPKSLIEKWQSVAMIEAIDQEQMYNAIGDILIKFSLEGIPVIALKGLVLRRLYPYPNLRTMSDFDILIKPDDSKRAHEILLDCGYKVESIDGIHTIYVNKELLIIELHRKLIPENDLSNSQYFETNIWMTARPIDINDFKVLALSYENEFIYLVHHMAHHIKGEGFGLRQLCDIVLFYKHYSQGLNFERLLDKARILKIETFLKAIMSICSALFKIELINELRLPESKENEDLIKNMVKYIIQGGVFGYQSLEQFTVGRMIHYSGGEIKNSEKNKVRFLCEFLFPGINKLDSRYEYAKKHHILLPIAWIHRLIISIFRKDLRLKEKLRVIRLMSSSDKYVAHSNLLKELGLLD